MSLDSKRAIATKRIFQTGAINFIRNMWLAVAAMAVITITLSILLFSVVARSTFSHTVSGLTDKIDVTFYLKDSVTPQQKDELITNLQKNSEVKSVDYINKDQALASYREQYKNNPELLTAISQTDNPLPASLRIKPTNPDNINGIRSYLNQASIQKFQSEQTAYPEKRKEAVDKIIKAANFMQKAGLAGIVVFLVVSVLIIFNTIQMAIFNRRDELAIMRLLGASTWYIRGPFVVETVIYGIIAAFISVALCYLLFVAASSAFEASSLGLLDIKFASSYFRAIFWKILAMQIALGIIIGAASSVLATRRHLKFKTSK